MKKFKVLFFGQQEIDSEPNYYEKHIFEETSKQVKTLVGFRQILTVENVNHPSPIVLQAAINKTTIALADFYLLCEQAAIEFEAEENRLCESGDKAALKRREKKEIAAQKAKNKNVIVVDNPEAKLNNKKANKKRQTT